MIQDTVKLVTNARCGFLVSLDRCLTGKLLNLISFSAHLHQLVQLHLRSVRVTDVGLLEGVGDVDRVFRISAQAEVQGREVGRSWWPLYWSPSPNPNRYRVRYAMKVLGCAMLLSSAQTTQRAFRSIVRMHNYWPVNHVRVHFPYKVEPGCHSSYSMKLLWTFRNIFEELLAFIPAVIKFFFHSFIHSQALIVQNEPLASLSGFLDHTHTDTRYDSSRWVISPTQRPLPTQDNTTYKHNIHSPSGIRTRDPSNQAAAGFGKFCFWVTTL
jgi:hypothetical protein